MVNIPLPETPGSGKSAGPSLAEALAAPAPMGWTGFLALKSAERRTARNGTSFMRCTFADAAMAVAANVFEDRAWFQPLAAQEWRPGDHFKVEGRVSTHPQYGRQIEIARIRPVGERDAAAGYRPEDLMESAPVDLDAFWRELLEAIAAVEPAPLRETVRALFEARADGFRTAAAARNAHHACRGGLLQHTVMMLREARALLAVPDFPRPHPGLVAAGILLHDLGKTVELEPYPRLGYTTEGSLVGHMPIVLAWLDAAAPAHGLEGEILLHLRHIILSHHGQHEFGAPVLPQTLEAMFVHLLDNLDAKLEMIRHAIARLEPHEAATEKLWALDNRTFHRSPAP